MACGHERLLLSDELSRAAGPDRTTERVSRPAGLAGPIVAVLLFFPTGIPALVHAIRSRRHRAAGERIAAARAASIAKKFTEVSVGLGLTFGVVAFLVYLMLAEGGAVRKGFFDWEVIWDARHTVLKGFRVNVSLFLVSEVIVLVWGLAVALARNLPGPTAAPVRFLATVYVDVFRGLPAILVIALIALGVPRVGLPVLSELSTFQYAVLALSLVYGAYVAEVYRAGIESIHWSQTAAARSLGLSHGLTMRYVIVPQAVRRIIPPLLNDFVGLQKDTALVAFIGTFDALNRARFYANNNANAFSAFTAVALCYVIITIPLARLTDWLVARDQARMRAGG